MKLLLEVQENKADFLLDLLQNFSFVKTQQLSGEDEADIAAYDKAMKRINAGKASFVSMEEVLRNMPQ